MVPLSKGEVDSPFLKAAVEPGVRGILSYIF